MRRTRRSAMLVALLLLLLVGGLGSVAVWTADRAGSDGVEVGQIDVDPHGSAARGEDAERSLRPRRERVRGSEEEANSATVGGDPADGTSRGARTRSEVGPEVEKAEPPTDKSAGVGADKDADAVAKSVRAVVRDAETGAPLRGARVLVVVVGRGWLGTTTDAEGRLRKDLTAAELEGVERIELRVKLQGFRTEVVPYDDAPLEIGMEPMDRPPESGRADVYVLDDQGAPVQSRFALSCYGPMEDHHGRLILTDASGRGVLHDLEPGAWRIGIAGSAFVDAYVPEGGETRLQVNAPAGGEVLDEETFTKRHRELQRQMTLFTTDQSTEASRTSGETQRSLGDAQQVVLQMQALETRWRLQRPGRDVELVGLSELAGGFVRVRSTHGPRQEWVVPRGSGIVVLPSLPPETWKVLVSTHERASSEREIKVELGQGEQGQGVQVIDLAR